MSKQESVIPPMVNPFVERAQKEKLLRQNAKVIWLTGLSGSGKTTLAIDFEKALHARGFLTQIFDADIVRSTFNRDLDYSLEGRLQNIHRVAHLSRLFLDSGIVVINCFISPTGHIRQLARKIIGPDDYLEVFVDAPLDVCESRDPKGLYRKARAGLIEAFTGIDSPYEPPAHPDLVLQTHLHTKEVLVEQLLSFVMPRISY